MLAMATGPAGGGRMPPAGGSAAPAGGSAAPAPGAPGVRSAVPGCRRARRPRRPGMGLAARMGRGPAHGSRAWHQDARRRPGDAADARMDAGNMQRQGCQADRRACRMDPDGRAGWPGMPVARRSQAARAPTTSPPTSIRPQGAVKAS